MKKVLLLFAGILFSSMMLAADKSTSPFTGISVEDAVGRQDLFLYNVESGYFLQDNRRNWSIWTTGAQLASQGMLLGIEDAGDGKYYIKSPFNNARMGWTDNNPASFYMDIAAGVALTFTTKAGVSNGYTIDDATHYLHAAAENNAGSGGAKIGYQLAWDNAGVRNTWQIVTREERENYLKANATKAAPLDATYLVGMPNVPRNVSIQGTGWGIQNWTITRDGGSQNLINNDLWDMNAWTFDNVTSVNVSQTVTGAPDGKYRARFYLMYSPTQIDNATEDLYNDWAANGDATVKVVAYAGGNETKATSYYSVDRATVQGAGEFYTNDYRLNKQLGSRFFAENWKWVARRMYVGDFRTEWIEFTVNNGKFDLGFKTIEGLDATSDIMFGGVEVEYMGLYSPFTGITPAEAAGRSDIFFYNVESGLWMQSNSRAWEFWTTHVQLDTQGLLMGLEADGGNYKIKSPFNPTGANKYLGSDLYLDNATPVSWTMASKSVPSLTNAFTIENGGNYLNASGADLSNDGDYRKRTGNLLNWDAGTRNTWQIVTRAEREAYIKANATAETPHSVNYLVGRPYQTRTNVANNWVITRDGGNQALERNGLWNWNVSEYWNMNSLNVSQTVSDVPNGKYRARFYLMYSPTNAGGVGESYIDYPVKAVGYAGGNEVLAKSYYSEEKSTATFVTNNFNLTKEINGKYYAANWDEVARRMYCGGFLTDWVEFNVIDGTFDLGIKTIDGLDAESWIVFGGVELEYMDKDAEWTVALTDGYATFSAAQDFSIVGSDVAAYKATQKNGNYVKIEEIADIPANTGVVLYGEGQTSVTLKMAASATADVSDNKLVANVTASTLPDTEGGNTNYILVKEGEKIVFAPTSGSGTLKAHRAYLQLPTDGTAKYFISFGDETGIENEVLNANSENATPVYNLQGQRVAAPTKGIFIQNGKKVVMK